MSASVWQRLAPPTRHPLDAVLADIDAYLAGPEAAAALEKSESTGDYPYAALAGLRARGLAELLTPQRATSPHLGSLNTMTARRSGSLAITVGVNALALLPVYLGGDDSQCAQVRDRLRRGEAAAMLLTELEHGSNLLRTRSRAEASGDGYRLTGAKDLINGGTEHEMLVVLMRTRESPADRPMAVLRDFSFLLVDRDDTVEATPRWRTLPTRAADISGVRFAGTFVPRERLIGSEGDGFPLVQKTLKLSHAGIAALASGVVSGAFERTLDYARTRDVYGGPIIGLGAIAEHCARMAALDVVVAAMAVKASWLANTYGAAAGYFSAIAKFACCLLAEEAVAEGRQVHGARALLEDLPYARFVRDVLLYGVFDGTSHVMLEDLTWYLPRFAAAGAKPARAKAASSALDALRTAYAAAPRPIRETAAGPWRPYAPPLTGRCVELAETTGDPAAGRLAELSAVLDAAVRASRQGNHWETDQAHRFEATGVLAELEALTAALELTRPESRAKLGLDPVAGRDADAAGFAVQWLGDRIAARIERLSTPPGDALRRLREHLRG